MTRYSYQILIKHKFSLQTFENISDIRKIHLLGSEMFHVDRWTDRHDEANSRFSYFCRHLKMKGFGPYLGCSATEKRLTQIYRSIARDRPIFLRRLFVSGKYKHGNNEKLNDCFWRS